MSAIMPERIKQIALIDAFGLISNSSERIIGQIQKYIQASDKLFIHTVYPSLEDAAKIRAISIKERPISYAGALVLAKGGMHSVSGGHSWSFDKRLQLPSAIMLTDNQVNTLLENFTSDCALIAASEGILDKYTTHVKNLENLDNIQVHKINGHHHLHLDSPEIVAKALATFFVS